MQSHWHVKRRTKSTFAHGPRRAASKCPRSSCKGCVLKAKDCIQRHQEGLDRLLVEHNKLLAQVVRVVNVENYNELDTAVVARVPLVVDLDAQSNPPSFDTKFGLCRSQSHLSSNPRHTPETPARYFQGWSWERSDTKNHHMMETLPTGHGQPSNNSRRARREDGL